MNSPVGTYIIVMPSAGRVHVEPMSSAGVEVADGVSVTGTDVFVAGTSVSVTEATKEVAMAVDVCVGFGEEGREEIPQTANARTAMRIKPTIPWSE